MPGLGDYQSIIQLAAGANFAFPITATMRKPAQDTIRREIMSGRRSLEELYSDFVVNAEDDDSTPKHIGYVRAVIQCAKEEVENLSERFSSKKETWASDDYWTLGAQIFMSIFAVSLLFLAVLHPSYQISVEPTQYYGMLHASDVARNVDVLVCLFLFGPLMRSLMKFCTRF